MKVAYFWNGDAQRDARHCGESCGKVLGNSENFTIIFKANCRKICRRLQGNCIPPSWEWLPSHFVRDFFKMTSTSSRLKKWAVQTQETHHPLFSSPCGGRTAKTSLSSLEKRGEIPCISHSPRNPFLHRWTSGIFKSWFGLGWWLTNFDGFSSTLTHSHTQTGTLFRDRSSIARRNSGGQEQKERKATTFRKQRGRDRLIGGWTPRQVAVDGGKLDPKTPKKPSGLNPQRKGVPPMQS